VSVKTPMTNGIGLLQAEVMKSIDQIMNAKVQVLLPLTLFSCEVEIVAAVFFFQWNIVRYIWSNETEAKFGLVGFLLCCSLMDILQSVPQS
jgi:hypothetical protein